MDTTFYLLILGSALSLITIVSGTDLTVWLGELVSFPCEASQGGTYFYRSWFRGNFSHGINNATTLFHQIGGADIERLPSGRTDMAVDSSSFRMTIGSVQLIDGDVFTCYQYQKAQPDEFVYSYVVLSLKGNNSVGLIVGICAGVIVLLLAAGLTVYTLKKRQGVRTSAPVVSVGISDEELFGDQDVVFYNEQE